MPIGRRPAALDMGEHIALGTVVLGGTTIPMPPVGVPRIWVGDVDFAGFGVGHCATCIKD